MRWEYKVVELDKYEYPPQQWPEVLRTLGEDGWELVGVSAGATSGYTYYDKGYGDRTSHGTSWERLFFKRGVKP